MAKSFSVVRIIIIVIIMTIPGNYLIFEKGNVLFFQLQFGTYLPMFRLDALAILIT